MSKTADEVFGRAFSEYLGQVVKWAKRDPYYRMHALELIEGVTARIKPEDMESVELLLKVYSALLEEMGRLSGPPKAPFSTPTRN